MTESDLCYKIKGRGGGAYASAPFPFLFWTLWLPGVFGLWVRGIWAAWEGKRQFPSVGLISFPELLSSSPKRQRWGVTSRGFYTGRFWPTLLGPPGRPASLSRGKRFEVLRLCLGSSVFARGAFAKRLPCDRPWCIMLRLWAPGRSRCARRPFLRG